MQYTFQYNIKLVKTAHYSDNIEQYQYCKKTPFINTEKPLIKHFRIEALTFSVLLCRLAEELGPCGIGMLHL